MCFLKSKSGPITIGNIQSVHWPTKPQNQEGLVTICRSFPKRKKRNFRGILNFEKTFPQMQSLEMILFYLAKFV